MKTPATYIPDTIIRPIEDQYHGEAREVRLGRYRAVLWREDKGDGSNLDAMAQEHGETIAAKFKRRNRKAYVAPRSPTSDHAFERKAEEYARWLANRDGIALPVNGRVTAHWSGVNALRSTGRSVWEKRIRAVSFGNVTLDLPNWDWQPVFLELVDEPKMVEADAPPIMAAGGLAFIPADCHQALVVSPC